jgi:hypothetical protein
MIVDIWRSFMRTPRWVQIWIFVILAPVNLAALAFLNAPFGVLIAVLAIGGMLPNLFIMLKERGVSRLMSIPHVVVWTPLVVLLAWVLATQDLSSGAATFFAVLLVVDVISLVFDFVDSAKWLKGAREIA